ncbi:uncharacterized protein G2W53_032717 [Senna tora]|uniref:Uncharacterized protein n=1 Tax=Senna tora TaxID=362788 RepID=A0A834SZP5_9FABA|nr:uncharacterized protein G2W53_032717 [Senna tora]
MIKLRICSTPTQLKMNQFIEHLSQIATLSLTPRIRGLCFRSRRPLAPRSAEIRFDKRRRKEEGGGGLKMKTLEFVSEMGICVVKREEVVDLVVDVWDYADVVNWSETTEHLEGFGDAA